MPDFQYRAKTAQGGNTTGVISATTHRDALMLLRKRSLFPMEVRSATPHNGWDLGELLPRRVKSETISDTLTQLADLLENGVSLLESLSILSQQGADPEMCRVLADVRTQVAEGTNLDVALAAHPRVFSPLATSMVRAGLEGSFLEEALERIASFLRKQNELQSKIIGAMIYPAILAVVGLAVTIGMVVFLVPMFESFFERLIRSGVGLPTPTVLLLGISDLLAQRGLIVAGLLAAIGFGIYRWMGTPQGTRVMDGIKLKLPVAGGIFHDSAVSRFCRVLGTLLKNGVPILKSLDISSTSAGNLLLQDAIRSSAENISSGNLLSQPLAASGLIPLQVMAMIRVAEESNTLDQVLVKISDRMDQKIEQRLETLVRLIEPLMLLAIGGILMFIIIAVLLPVFELNSAMG